MVPKNGRVFYAGNVSNAEFYAVFDTPRRAQGLPNDARMLPKDPKMMPQGPLKLKL
jgi:hypothetical protein